jgi:rRNA maturation endonuclease Nob1
MDTQRNITHRFDISNAKAGDWFLGCLKCVFQMDFNTAAKPECPECGSRLYVFTVTETDIQNSQRKDISTNDSIRQ